MVIIVGADPMILSRLFPCGINVRAAEAARHGRLCSFLCEPAHSACTQEVSSMNKRSGLNFITLMIHDDTTSKLSLSDLRASLGTGPALQCYFIIRGPTVRDLPDEFIHREGTSHAGNHLRFPLISVACSPLRGRWDMLLLMSTSSKLTPLPIASRREPGYFPQTNVAADCGLPG